MSDAKRDVCGGGAARFIGRFPPLKTPPPPPDFPLAKTFPAVQPCAA